VVIQDRLDALLPLTPLMRQRVPQPDLGAEIQQMIGRDPGLRQPADRRQLTNVPRIGAVALGALLVPPPSRGLSRLGQMHDRADLRQLVGNKPPTRRGLQRDLELLAAELLTEPSDSLPMRRRDPRPRDLAGLGVQPLRDDLRSVLIKPHHDRHRTAASLARLARSTPRADPSRLTATPGRPAAHAIYQVTPEVLDGDGRHINRRSASDRKIAGQPEAVRDHPLREARTQRAPSISH